MKGKRVTLWTEAEHITLSGAGVRVVGSGGYRTELEVDTDVVSLGAVLDAAERQTLVRDLTVEDPPLDEVIRALYAGADARSA